MKRTIAAAALGGFACMAAELTAVRILAPSFGDSAYVWTNVIGVILAALAVGAWFGGRLASRPNAAIWPPRLFVTAGLLVACVPFLARPLGAWLLPSDLPLDAAMPALVRGSFVATVVLFVIPMFCLGAISPLLVSGLVAAQVAVGRAAGSVGAAGTLGSLGGTFLATHWLVPEFGCRAALAVAGAALVLAGVLVAPGGRAKGIAAASLAAILVSPMAHQGLLRLPPPDREVLAERESRYQYLQVQRSVAVDAPERRMLVINEGLDSFHSLAIAGSAFTGGAYYDWHALAPLLAGNGRRPAGLRALSIGDAAGSLRAVYAGVHPGATVDAVDIDPACMELGRTWFLGAKAVGGQFGIDGRVFLDQAQATWHVIHVDAYAHQVYVPAHLASREFFAAARQRLEPDGVIACNVGALHREDPVLRAIAGTMAAVFGQALALQVPNSRNFLLVARRGNPPEPERLAQFVFGEERLLADDQDHWRTLVTAAAEPGLWTRIGANTEPLLDDRPVLDRLLYSSYVAREEPNGLLPCAGTTEVAAAELEAYARRKVRDWNGVLTAVASSRSATAYLRELAGDARWSLRELQSARREYAAALELAREPAVRDRLQGNLTAIAADWEPIERADRAAVRNGWLQGGLCLALLLLTCLLWRFG